MTNTIPTRGDQRLTVVYGIGEAIESELHDHGILSLYDLAAATPEALRPLDSISESDAEAFIADAKVTLGIFE